MIMLQIIQRLDLGCAFDIALYLTDKEVVPTVPNIFYQTTAVTTSTGDHRRGWRSCVMHN